MNISRFERLDVLPHEIAEALRRHPSFAAQQPLRLVPRRQRRTEHGAVYQIDVIWTSRHETYWVKVHTQGRGRARREFVFLVDARRLEVDVDGATSVEPYACLDDHDAVITRHADGVQLSSLIPNGFSAGLLRRSRVRQLAQWCCLAGRWLGRFHQAFPGDGRYGGPADAVELVIEVLRRPEYRWHPPAELRVRAEELASELAERVPPEDLTSVRLHGDYGAHNTLVKGERLVVLDPSFSRNDHEGDQYHSRFMDITRFWATIQGNTRSNLRSAKRAQLVQSFLDSYNEVTGLSITPSQPAFRLFAIRHLMLGLRDWPSLVGWCFPPARSSALSAWLSSNRFEP